MSNIFSAILLGCCAILTVLLLIPYDVELLDTSEISSNEIKQQVKLNQLAVEKRREFVSTEFNDFENRPLFNSSREKQVEASKQKKTEVESRPVIQNKSVSPQKKVQKPKPALPSLTGILLIDEVQMAFVIDQHGQARSLKKGDDLQGWHVHSIEQNALELKYQGDAEIVRLLWANTELLDDNSDSAKNKVESIRPTDLTNNEPSESLNLKQKLARQIQGNRH